MPTTAPYSMGRLYWVALGSFAIGTEGFMIAPLLPHLARDLSVSLVSAGQLVTVFALTYALSSPVLTALTGDVDRRRLLIASMLAFAAANYVAWSANSYSALLAARILLAVAAGLYVPNASAFASAIVDPSRRGTALSIVTGGTSVAVALACLLARSSATASAEFCSRWRAGIDCDRRTAERATPRHRRPAARREPPRAPRRGASACGSSRPVQQHVLGDRRFHRLHLPCVVPRARRGNRGIVRQRRAVHVGRCGDDRSQAWWTS
jgi:hypothetical protein